ncbi:MAG: hypothetical protein WBX22_04610 [Silvibacterium sp.]
MRKATLPFLAVSSLLLAASHLLAQEVEVYRTTPNLKEALHRDASLHFSPTTADHTSDVVVIDVDAQQRFQSIDGFGASLTDSSRGYCRSSFLPLRGRK